MRWKYWSNNIIFFMLDMMFEMFSKKFGKLLIIILISKNEILVLKIVYLINKNSIFD